MVSDPYKVLGVSRDADKETIKKAYRQKAKQYHPDLNPDDPVAAEKMNEVNEAYDMLSNPEKYRGQTGYGNAYGGFGSYDFDDFFGFGRYRQTVNIPRPTAEAGDSPNVRQVIDFVNMGQYRYAAQVLNSMVSAERNDRWYYLSAIVNYQMGQSSLALEQIQRAMQLAPGKVVYQQTYAAMKQAGTAYQQAGREYQSAVGGMEGLCTKLCWLNFLCMCCCRC